MIASAERGGVSTVTMRLGVALADAGHDIVIHVLTGRRSIEAPTHPRVQLVEWNAPNVRSTLFRIRRLFLSRQFEAVISAQYYVNVIVALARPRRSPERLLFVEHGTISLVAAHGNRRDRLMPMAMRWAYRRADAVASVSRGAANDLSSLLGWEPDAVEVLPNPVLDDVDPPEAPEPPDHQWFTDRDVPTVLFVGRLAPEKRLGDLIYAFDTLTTTRIARLIIVGDGPERERLEGLVAQTGRADAVWFAGDRSDAVAFMHHCDALVLCSEFEGHPVVLVEALNVGCRIVSTDCQNGPREILQGGRLGRLVPVADPPALAEGIDVVLDDPRPDRAEIERAVRPYRAAHSARRYMEVLLVREHPGRTTSAG